ncbi:MAG: hypothetical protein ACOYOS_19770 [Syntrophales bacterium]
MKSPAFQEHFQIKISGLQRHPRWSLPENRSTSHIRFSGDKSKLRKMADSCDKPTGIYTLFTEGIFNITNDYR